MLDDPAEEAAAQAIAVILREGKAKFAALLAEHAAEVAALRLQNAELRAAIIEQRAALNEKVDARLATVRNGESVTIADLHPVIGDAVSRAVAALPPAPKGDPGESVDASEIEAMIAEKVARAVAELPPDSPGKPGESVTVDDVRPLVDEAVTRAMSALPPPEKGESVTADDIAPMLVEMVERAVAALPPAEPGKPGEPGESVTVEQLAPLVEREVAARIAALPKPKDGIGAAGALIDRDGKLVLTLSDGSTRELGLVVGRSVEPTAVAEMVREAVAAIPAPKDGFGFEDLSVAHDGERRIVLRFERGAERKEFPLDLPAMIYRGVFKDGAAYVRGDTVTWSGSLWHANEQTGDRPGEGQKAWTLVAKRGRDAKEVVSIKGPQPPVKVSP